MPCFIKVFLIELIGREPNTPLHEPRDRTTARAACTHVDDDTERPPQDDALEIAGRELAHRRELTAAASASAPRAHR
jgi:hypothetical protein